jgi:hypothetical protein
MSFLCGFSEADTLILDKVGSALCTGTEGEFDGEFAHVEVLGMDDGKGDDGEGTLAHWGTMCLLIYYVKVVFIASHLAQLDNPESLFVVQSVYCHPFNQRIKLTHHPQVFKPRHPKRTIPTPDYIPQGNSCTAHP